MVVAALGLTIAVAPWLAQGHVVFGTITLRLLTVQSDLVVRVRIVDPAAELTLEQPPLRQTFVVAEVLEPLKGHYDEKQLRFVQHGHGVVSYAKGEEAVLFVGHIAKNPEISGSHIAEHLHWVSQQETGEKFAIDEKSRDDIIAAVRAYAALEKLAPEAQHQAMRRITLEMLGSPHEVLASAAMRDLVLSGGTLISSAEDLPLFEPILDSPQTSIGVRIGLLAELERRKFVAGPPRWAKLLRTTRGAERLAAVRASGVHPSEEVVRELLKLLATNDIQLVAATAVSLGNQHTDVAVTPLVKLLASSEWRLRMAAIRGLGRVGTVAATQALAKAAEFHADHATRRRAAAEVSVLGRRGETVQVIGRQGEQLPVEESQQQ